MKVLLYRPQQILWWWSESSQTIRGSIVIGAYVGANGTSYMMADGESCQEWQLARTFEEIAERVGITVEKA